MDQSELFWIAGKLEGQLPLLAPDVRESVDLALVDIAWKSYLRDAGPGETGPMFSGWKDADHVLLSADPRAGALLAWLSTRDGPLRSAAERLHKARGSSGIRFNADEKELLRDAGDMLRSAGVNFSDAPPVDQFARAIHAFRDDWRFASGPPGQSEEVGGAWAINLVLATFKAEAPQLGILTRQSLRADLDFEPSVLVEAWTRALQQFAVRTRVVVERMRGAGPVLAGLSKNARARNLVGALGALDTFRRVQVKRGWDLSDAGTTLLMRQLVEIGVATPTERGSLSWSLEPPKDSYARNENDTSINHDVIREFDDAMAAVDNLIS